MCSCSASAPHIPVYYLRDVRSARKAGDGKLQQEANDARESYLAMQEHIMSVLYGIHKTQEDSILRKFIDPAGMKYVRGYLGRADILMEHKKADNELIDKYHSMLDGSFSIELHAHRSHSHSSNLRSYFAEAAKKMPAKSN